MKETHATFETYCRERWGWGRHYANRQIRAAKATDAMVPTGTKPANEWQARAMLDTKPQKRPAAERAAQITKLAAEGNTAEQIGGLVGLGVDRVRVIARTHDCNVSPHHDRPSPLCGVQLPSRKRRPRGDRRRSTSPLAAPQPSRGVGNLSTAALQQPRSSGSASVSIMCTDAGMGPMGPKSAGGRGTW